MVKIKTGTATAGYQRFGAENVVIPNMDYGFSISVCLTRDKKEEERGGLSVGVEERGIYSDKRERQKDESYHI